MVGGIGEALEEFVVLFDPLGELFAEGGHFLHLLVDHGELLDGDFAAGDPVDLLDPEGRPVARGLVNFDASELPALLGRSSHELKRELGAAYEREVVHRDDLVLL